MKNGSVHCGSEFWILKGPDFEISKPYRWKLATILSKTICNQDKNVRIWHGLDHQYSHSYSPSVKHFGQRLVAALHTPNAGRNIY